MRISGDQICLYFEGKLLSQYKPLSSFTEPSSFTESKRGSSMFGILFGLLHSYRPHSTLSLDLYLKKDMSIFIRASRKRIHLKVHQLDTINSVKEQIRNKVGIQPDQKLKFDGRVLENEFTLKDYNIKSNSTINLVSIIQIYIKTLDGNMRFEAETEDTIYKVKTMIHDKVGIPPV